MSHFVVVIFGFTFLKVMLAVYVIVSPGSIE